jgi:hypothetical protein
MIGLVVFVVVTPFVAMWMRRNQIQIDSSPLSSKESVSEAASTKPSLPPIPATSQGSVDRAERTRALLNAGNVAITFWGKVIDEDGAGIPGVIIKYRIQRAGRLEADGTIAEDGILASISSNADGSFSITNASGTTLSMVDLTKEGYEELSSNQNKVFGYYGTPVLHMPKQQSPQVFMMRSNKKQNDVSSVSQQLRLPWGWESNSYRSRQRQPVAIWETGAHREPHGFNWSLWLEPHSCDRRRGTHRSRAGNSSFRA